MHGDYNRRKEAYEKGVTQYCVHPKGRNLLTVSDVEELERKYTEEITAYIEFLSIVYFAMGAVMEKHGDQAVGYRSKMIQYDAALGWYRRSKAMGLKDGLTAARMVRRKYEAADASKSIFGRINMYFEKKHHEKIPRGFARK